MIGENEMQIYQAYGIQLKFLRYLLLYAIYLLFAKDWKSLSQMLMMNKLYNLRTEVECFIRAFLILLNEFVVFIIVITTNLGEEKGTGLIVNFSAALIVCELDDITMAAGRIQFWRDRFNN
jgi:hypothetical protein